MTESKYLKDMLCLMVDRHGHERVDRALREIVSAHRRKNPNKKKALPKSNAKAKTKKTTALEYVVKMDLPSDKKPVMAELAKRFDEKKLFAEVR